MQTPHVKTYFLVMQVVAKSIGGRGGEVGMVMEGGGGGGG
jgi:hypothetical protein